MSTATMGPSYGSPAEIARFVGLSVPSVRRLYRSGQLRAQQVGRRVLISYRDAEFLVRSRIRPVSGTDTVASSLDARGQATTLGPIEAHHRTRAALDLLGGEPAGFDPDEVADLARLQAGMRDSRGVA